jgi:hypothetical protein
MLPGAGISRYLMAIVAAIVVLSLLVSMLPSQGL